MVESYVTYYDSVIGKLKVAGSGSGISFVGFVDDDPLEAPRHHADLEACIRQLDEYFRGTRRTFSLKLAPEGTDFQKRVWERLRHIPYGETVCYKDIAKAIGDEKAVRAVGNANGKNRISIIIPCHRVIGSDGSLTGYGGGLWRKEWLLNHEKE